MNKVILLGRLTRNPDVRYTQANPSTCIARFTIAVDRRFKKDGEQNADFPSCVSFGKTAEFIEKYMKQGTKVCLSGRIQTGSYTNREGQKAYTTDIVVEEIDFAESKKFENANNEQTPAAAPVAGDGFMSIPEGVESELPFI